MLLGILSAVFGTVLMTLSSETEMILSGRPASLTPGLAFSRVLQFAGGPELTGKALKIASTWVHWMYGSAWGIIFWLIAGPGNVDLELAGLLYWIIVWGAAQIEMPLLGVAKPVWQYGTNAVLIDGWHHAVYAAGTAAGWQLIRLA